MTEYAKTISSQNKQLLSIIHQGSTANDTAVLFLVGGPQYRVGSHRQFVQLARFLAKAGITSMRFDYRGMGDSFGEKMSFDESAKDISTALDALQFSEPNIKKVYLWGLCDAASMALIYGWQDKRVQGLILLNPWLENESARAKVMLTHYYIKRFFSRSFWHKLVTGKVDVSASVNDINQLTKVQEKTDKVAVNQLDDGYQSKMLLGMKKFDGPITFILSGNDLTARTFKQQIKQSRSWGRLVSQKSQLHTLSKADHTFSRKAWKQEVEQLTLNALNRMS